jgi:pilus assembly protein Flp/PilA
MPAVVWLEPATRAFADVVQQVECVMKTLFNRFVSEEAGQDLIEYALLAGLISIVCVLAIQAAGTKVSTLFNNVRTSIP